MTDRQGLQQAVPNPHGRELGGRKEEGFAE
jgi:hypothetical protein